MRKPQIDWKLLFGAGMFGLLCTLVIVLLPSQVPPNQKPTSFSYTYQTRPGPIPSTPTDVVRTEAYVCSGWISGTGQTITIQDRQPTAIPWINAALGLTGQQTTTTFPIMDDSRCIWFPNGITWSANTSGATGYLTIKCTTPCTLVSSL